jgi:hypothetical protein
LATYPKSWVSRSGISRIWIAAVAACLATLVVAALFLHQSFFLNALSDVIQSLLLIMQLSLAAACAFSGF